MEAPTVFANPYRPGAGHMPPHLAGREREYQEFDRLLGQDTILENMVLTGLRGVGKTVLLEKFRPRAIAKGWLWVGTDLSESASVTETNLATRILTDLSIATSIVTTPISRSTGLGFSSETENVDVPVDFQVLSGVYDSTPGLVSDKLKAVLEFAFDCLSSAGASNRIIFAYDEAQNLSDNAQRDQFPLSVLLDVFQSIQRKGLPFLLVLTGLPTLFPKLVEARTYSERMFRVLMLAKLDGEESRAAISKPLDVANCPVRFDPSSVDTICRESGGYPYFIQFVCREVFDVIIQQIATGQKVGEVPFEAIQRKLDTDFFAGRWASVTDRQRQLLYVAASLDRSDDEFAIQELVALGKDLLDRPFSSSHANQILASLGERGLIYKNRFGKYSFAVPLLGAFILRTYELPAQLD